MEHNQRFLAWPAYLMAAILIVFPFAEAILSVLPWRPGLVTWRYGAAGLASRALMTPMLGALMLAGIALLFEHRRFLRGLAIASAAAGVLLLPILGFFLLDALQVRAQLKPEFKEAFDAGTVQATAKFAIAALWLGLLSVGSFRASRRPAGERRGDRHRAPILAASSAAPAAPAASPPAKVPAEGD